MTKNVRTIKKTETVVECAEVAYSSGSSIFETSKTVGKYRKEKNGFFCLLWGVAAVILLFACSFGGATAVFAADSSSVDDTPMSITNNITDTQNLLGDDIDKVTAAIDKTKKLTGVTLNILYIPHFDSTMKPEEWTQNILASSKPKHNTVLLAVASEDGALVVAVSSNSDEWLKNQEAVEMMSDATLKPIIEDSSPDWVAGAIALADQIDNLQETQTSDSQVVTGIVIFSVVGFAIVAFVVFLLIMHLRRVRKMRDDNGKGNREKRGAAHSAHTRPQEKRLREKRPRRNRKGSAKSADTENDTEKETERTSARAILEAMAVDAGEIAAESAESADSADSADGAGNSENKASIGPVGWRF